MRLRIVIAGTVHFGEAEVEKLHAAARDQDIGQLQVAMQDSLVVSGFEREKMGDSLSPRTADFWCAPMFAKNRAS